MATERDRASFEHWHIQRQRSRGYGAFLSDAEFVTRDESGRYRTLGLDDALEAWCAALASAPAIEPVSPMAKMAQALRDKAAAEKASFDTRVQSGEWGPAPDAGTEADCQLEHVAQVEGDAVVRTLRWNKNVGAFEYPVGTKLYAASAALASAPAADEPVASRYFDALRKLGFADSNTLRVIFWHQAGDLKWHDGEHYYVPGATAPQPAEPAQPAPQAGVVESQDQMDAIALARFKVLPTTSGYWGWCIKAGDGEAELYKGHKSDCELVARRMVGAFLDGGHKALGLLAAHPTEQPSQDAAWQKIGDEVTLILSDPDSELSDGAKRALEWIAEVAGARAAQAQGGANG